MGEQATYTTERLDHLGIVAGICREIELVKRVDTLAGDDDRAVMAQTRHTELLPAFYTSLEPIGISLSPPRKVSL